MVTCDSIITCDSVVTSDSVVICDSNVISDFVVTVMLLERQGDKAVYLVKISVKTTQ